MARLIQLSAKLINPLRSLASRASKGVVCPRTAEQPLG